MGTPLPLEVMEWMGMDTAMVPFILDLASGRTDEAAAPVTTSAA